MGLQPCPRTTGRPAHGCGYYCYWFANGSSRYICVVEQFITEVNAVLCLATSKRDKRTDCDLIKVKNGDQHLTGLPTSRDLSITISRMFINLYTDNRKTSGNLYNKWCGNQNNRWLPNTWWYRDQQSKNPPQLTLPILAANLTGYTNIKTLCMKNSHSIMQITTTISKYNRYNKTYTIKPKVTWYKSNMYTYKHFSEIQIRHLVSLNQIFTVGRILLVFHTMWPIHTYFLKQYVIYLMTDFNTCEQSQVLLLRYLIIV